MEMQRRRGRGRDAGAESTHENPAERRPGVLPRHDAEVPGGRVPARHRAGARGVRRRLRARLLATGRRARLDVAARARGARRREHQRLGRGRPHPRRRRVRCARRARAAPAGQHRGRRARPFGHRTSSRPTCSRPSSPARSSRRGRSPNRLRTTRSARSRCAPIADGDDFVPAGRRSRRSKRARRPSYLLVTASDRRRSRAVPRPRDAPGVDDHAAPEHRPGAALRDGPASTACVCRRPPRSATPGDADADVERQLQLAARRCRRRRSVGAAQVVFDLTVEWAFNRYSFGRPLASYQELKHRFADMKMWLEASHALASAAAREVAGRGAERRRRRSAPRRRTAATTSRSSSRTACRCTVASVSPTTTTSTCTCAE